MNNQLGQVFTSSSDPKELGMMVKGLLMSAVPVIVILSKQFGIEGLDSNILTESVDVISNATIAVTAAVSSVMIAFGFLRKVYNNIKGIVNK